MLDAVAAGDVLNQRKGEAAQKREHGWTGDEIGATQARKDGESNLLRVTFLRDSVPE